MFSWRRSQPRRGTSSRHAAALGLSLRQRPRLEPLEDRCVPASIAVGANVNISQLPGNQDETALAINPLNPNNILAVSNDEASFLSLGGGIRVYRSLDGGGTWSSQVIGTGFFGDGLPLACCDGELAFDNFGNLFLVYLSPSRGNAVMLRSSNGGATFGLVQEFPASDQPSVAAGAGMVWVLFSGPFSGTTTRPAMMA